MTFRAVLSEDELWNGELVGRELSGVPILLVRCDGCVYAYEDRCAHQRAKLSDGRLNGRTLTCAMHEWQYDTCTGAGINPEGVRLHSFPVRIENGTILVDVEEAP